MPSIHPSRAAIGLLLFAVLFLAALGYVVDQEIGKQGQGAMATMVAVAQALGSVAVSLTALTVIIVEGVPMLYEAFKKAKLAQGREQGRAAETAGLGRLDCPPRRGARGGARLHRAVTGAA